MPRLIDATEEQIRSVMKQSHALWGSGLAPDAYLDHWTELREMAWGRRNFRHRVWAGPDGHVLSSMKVYRPLARLGEQTFRVTVFGAVFTPSTARGLGHGAAMLRAGIDVARREGDRLALLFSDIGRGYYEDLGFRAVPSEEAEGRLGSAGPPAGAEWVLRPMQPDDLERVGAWHERSSSRRAFALVRDREHWEFLWQRAAGFFSRLDGSDLAGRYRIALENGRPAGYLISVEGGREWSVREIGAEGGDPRRLRAILRTGAEAARRGGRRRVHGWLPRAYAGLVPEWNLSFRVRERAIPMFLPLASGVDLAALDGPDTAFIPYLDQF